MKDSVAEAKQELGSKRAGFTRRHRAFQCLIEAKVQDGVLTGVYKYMGQAYNVLDRAYES